MLIETLKHIDIMSNYTKIEGHNCIIVDTKDVDENGKHYLELTFEAIDTKEQFIRRMQYANPGEEF